MISLFFTRVLSKDDSVTFYKEEIVKIQAVLIDIVNRLESLESRQKLITSPQSSISIRSGKTNDHNDSIGANRNSNEKISTSSSSDTNTNYLSKKRKNNGLL